MAEGKERRGRRDHLNDFYRDVSGNYVYTGTCYVCRAAEKERTALHPHVSHMTALMSDAVVAADIKSPKRKQPCFYVLLPYAAEVGLTGSVVWATVRWQAREYPMREYVYRATVQALPGRCLGEAIAAGVGLAAEVVYLLLSGSGGRGALAAAYLALKAVSLVAALFARQLVRRSAWEPVGKSGEIPAE